MIRPAKCHFDGFIKAFIKGADKNHNPRKGTETFLINVGLNESHFVDKNHNPRKGTETMCSCQDTDKDAAKIRTIIPARGRKRTGQRQTIFYPSYMIRTIIPARGRKLYRQNVSFKTYFMIDKNHNPRKGTETPYLRTLITEYRF